MNIAQVHGLSFNQFLHPCTHAFTASISIANNRFIKEEQKRNPFHIMKNSVGGVRFHTRPLKSSQSDGNKSVNCLKFSADNHSVLDTVHRLKKKKYACKIRSKTKLCSISPNKSRCVYCIFNLFIRSLRVENICNTKVNFGCSVRSHVKFW